MAKIIVGIISAIGEVVYYTMYVPVYVAWHLVGKPIYRIVREVKGQDEVNEQLADIARYGNIVTLREILVRMYYNAVMEEAACARFA